MADFLHSASDRLQRTRATKAGSSSESSHEMVDDEMDDAVVLRGLLQCMAIGVFFTSRYALDVLPPAS